jgi:23S rRNA (uridine2552-2'-O)-methyltransferase
MAIKDRGRIDDHYSRKARKEGYPARSVYKLEEFDQKYGLLRAGQKILDLGCAPGGWTLYAAGRVGSGGLVIGLDVVPPEAASFPSQVAVRRADLLEDDFAIIEDDSPFDVILSDMAPKTTGRREVDQARSLRLCQMAWKWAETLLKPGGHFLFKIFQSQEGDDFIKILSPHFEKIARLKPKATREKSLEIFILGQNKKCR